MPMCNQERHQKQTEGKHVLAQLDRSSEDLKRLIEVAS